MKCLPVLVNPTSTNLDTHHRLSQSMLLLGMRINGPGLHRCLIFAGVDAVALLGFKTCSGHLFTQLLGVSITLLGRFGASAQQSRQGAAQLSWMMSA